VVFFRLLRKEDRKSVSKRATIAFFYGLFVLLPTYIPTYVTYNICSNVKQTMKGRRIKNLVCSKLLENSIIYGDYWLIVTVKRRNELVVKEIITRD
jgi:hypothetical protein